MLEHSIYHSLLRIVTLTVALVLVFDSGLLHPITKNLADNTQQYLASAIGVKASVTPNELNQLTAELTAQKNALQQREAAVTEREIAVGLNEGGSNTVDSTLLLSAILSILLILILMNYILDFMRAHRRPAM